MGQPWDSSGLWGRRLGQENKQEMKEKYTFERKQIEQRSAARKDGPSSTHWLSRHHPIKSSSLSSSFAHCPPFVISVLVCNGRQVKESRGAWLPAEPARGNAGKEKSLLFLLQTLLGPWQVHLPAVIWRFFKRLHFERYPDLSPLAPEF